MATLRRDLCFTKRAPRGTEEEEEVEVEEEVEEAAVERRRRQKVEETAKRRLTRLFIEAHLPYTKSKR